MAGQPTNRAEFKEFVLRALGKGALRINVTDDQVEDRIAFALKKAQDYHFDFARDNYFKFQVTPTIKESGGLTLPENVLGAVEIFSLSDTTFGGGIFNAQYQFVLDNIWEWQTASMIPYFMTFQHLSLIEQLLVGLQPIRYNRYMNRLDIDMSWDRLNEDAWVIVKVYEMVDPDTYARLWQDEWLQKYAIAQVKYQWGSNMSKFTGLPVSGGMVMNGQKIKEEAAEEIKRLDKEVIWGYGLPPDPLVG